MRCEICNDNFRELGGAPPAGYRWSVYPADLDKSLAPPRQLDQLFVLFELHIEVRKGDVEYYKFGSAVVSEGTVKLQGGKAFKVATVQAAGDSNIRIKIDVKGDKRASPRRKAKRNPRKHGPTDKA